MNKQILLKRRPEGKPSVEDFEFREIENPKLKAGQVLLESRYISVDPYLRGRMRDEESYI